MNKLKLLERIAQLEEENARLHDKHFSEIYDYRLTIATMATIIHGLNQENKRLLVEQDILMNC